MILRDKAMSKIGILGGTFDPIHFGHLMIAQRAYEQLGLDVVWIMPAGRPPHKRERDGRATNVQRTEMTRLAIAGNPHFVLALREMNADGYSYTYRTLEGLRKEMPDAEFTFIMGADSLHDFTTWREPQRICNAARIAVAMRDHVEQETLREEMDEVRRLYQADIVELYTPNIDVSSSALREMIAGGADVRYCMPEKVAEYIAREGIYRLQPDVAGEKESVTDAGISASEGAVIGDPFDFSLPQIEDALRGILKPHRFYHTQGVRYTACALAMRFGCDLMRAEKAGLLHDCAKYMSGDALLTYCREHALPVEAVEEKSPHLLHGKVGADMAEKIYGVTDPEILSAIRFHTVGRPAMTLLEKIIFVADYIEPGREYPSASLRKLAFEDLDAAVCETYREILSYLHTRDFAVDPATEEGYRYYSVLRRD